MSGRADYEERRQARIDRLNDAAAKAAKESEQKSRIAHDLVKNIPLETSEQLKNESHSWNRLRLCQ